eukprot:CAMPEP_0185693806 /NCGR_PEP_ID=MMETSP1164-20130828/3481_1 /TAXON_ID=1104430 /ORGANISM="Chrysoreinhardia sp, Strain CCMP2950" /LENGTH=87 /DNA_ID=CAMNT_0028360613 /DNA_START=24 /DNA_END=283 /DNA_ORIENTATION=-
MDVDDGGGPLDDDDDDRDLDDAAGAASSFFEASASGAPLSCWAAESVGEQRAEWWRRLRTQKHSSGRGEAQMLRDHGAIEDEASRIG